VDADVPNPTYSNIMLSTHGDSVIADAYLKGIRGFDLNKAYAATYKTAMTPPDGDATKPLD
jgi:putative alpha-1,2-mannosidase